jgi:hypothetical protein
LPRLQQELANNSQRIQTQRDVDDNDNDGDYEFGEAVKETNELSDEQQLVDNLQTLLTKGILSKVEFECKMKHILCR